MVLSAQRPVLPGPTKNPLATIFEQKEEGPRVSSPHQVGISAAPPLADANATAAKGHPAGLAAAVTRSFPSPLPMCNVDEALHTKLFPILVSTQHTHKPLLSPSRTRAETLKIASKSSAIFLHLCGSQTNGSHLKELSFLKGDTCWRGCDTLMLRLTCLQLLMHSTTRYHCQLLKFISSNLPGGLFSSSPFFI